MDIETTPTLIASDADAVLGRWNTLVVRIWRGPTTAEGLRAYEGEIERLGRAHGRGVAVLAVVEEGAPLPDAAARRGLAELITRHALSIRGYALVCEGSGFRAAAVRAVSLSIAMIIRPQLANDVFTDTAAAARWLAPRFHLASGRAPSPLEIEGAAAELRRLGAAGRPALSRSGATL